jgi:hypothetical protein
MTTNLARAVVVAEPLAGGWLDVGDVVASTQNARMTLKLLKVKQYFQTLPLNDKLSHYQVNQNEE